MLCCVSGSFTASAFTLRTYEHLRWEESLMPTTLLIALLLFAAYLLLRYHEE